MKEKMTKKKRQKWQNIIGYYRIVGNVSVDLNKVVSIKICFDIYVWK